MLNNDVILARVLDAMFGADLSWQAVVLWVLLFVVVVKWLLWDLYVKVQLARSVDDPERFRRCLKLRQGFRLFRRSKADEADD